VGLTFWKKTSLSHQSASSGSPSVPKGDLLFTASPLGEEEPGPEGAERGGYSPIPRSEARAGEWKKFGFF